MFIGSIWHRFFSVAVIGFMTGTAALAQYQWNGGTGNPSWGSAANWTNGSTPPPAYNGIIYFSTNGIGGLNQLDQDRGIRGLYYNHFSNASNLPPPAHTTDLNGFTLIISNADFRAGYNFSNTHVTIQNGTLQLGHPNNPANLIVALNSTPSPGPDYTGTLVTVTATLDTLNAGSVIVGRNSYGNAQSAQGRLDLSGATLRSGSDLNTLRLNNDLGVGYSSGGSAGPGTRGHLLLPPTLTTLSVSNFYVGYERYSTGLLDFGAGSSLTGFTVRGNFYLSYWDGPAQILNFPTNVVVSVGLSNAPSQMILGYHSVWTQVPITGAFTVAQGRFTAHLSQLLIGWADAGDVPPGIGSLDLGSSQVQIGSVSNAIRIPKLLIGTKQGYDGIANCGPSGASGTLRIPPSITRIEAGTLALGSCLNSIGLLDIGSNSLLNTLTLTNGLYLGGGVARIGYSQGSNFVDQLPTGLVVTIGSTNLPAVCWIGHRPPGQYTLWGETVPAGTGRIVLVNGSFAGYLSSLRLGVKEDSTKSVLGRLDLSNSTLVALQIQGDALIGCATNPIYGSSIESSNRNGRGELILPAGTVSISSNLFVGDDDPASAGLLDLFDTRIEIGGKFQINRTGTATVHVGAASAGFVLSSALSNDFTIASAGRLRLQFNADPTNVSSHFHALRMRGNQISHFNNLVSDGRLSWETPGLSAPVSAKVGIYFDAGSDSTLVGVLGTAVPPEIENRPATNVQLLSACLNGYLTTTGSHPTAVSVYWGAADGGHPTSGLWSATNTFSPGAWSDVSYPTTPVTFTTSNLWYYYRYAASSEVGFVSATSSTRFLAGNIWVTVPDSNASETGPDPGTFTVWRVSSSTGLPLTVSYALGGDAVAGVDYDITPAPTGLVTLAVGSDHADLSITPIVNATPETTEFIILQLIPGAYVIGAPASNTITLLDAGSSTNTTPTDCGPWTGLGLNESWGNAANWASNSAPEPAYSGKILFTNQDVGGGNRLETNRMLSGPAQSVSHGLHYNVNAPPPGGPHLTDLGGQTLTLNGGSLQVGYNASNSVAVISNGTLQLGAAARSDLYVGANLATTTPDLTRTGANLRVIATLNAQNLGSIWIGRSDRGNGPGAQGRLDLSGAGVRSGSLTNQLLIAGNLHLGVNNGAADSLGELILPSTLTDLEVGDLVIANERNARALLDFSPGSVLTNLKVRNNFHLSHSGGIGTITNLPANLSLSIGSTTSPASLRIATCAASDSNPYQIHTGSVTLTGGRLTAYLSELIIGRSATGNEMPADGTLILDTSVVQIGPLPQALAVPQLQIGNKQAADGPNGGTTARGLLKLPPSLTNLTVGTLALGSHNGCQGRIDIGSSSQLRLFAITNDLFMGGGEAAIGYTSGTNFVDYLPTGIQVRIGLPTRPAYVQIGRRHPSQYPAYGEPYPNRARLIVSNGLFAGYFSRLLIGMKENSVKTSLGVLDLRNSTLEVFQVRGDLVIGRDTGEPPYLGLPGQNVNSNGQGFVHLPAGVATVYSNLYVGDFVAGSTGVLELVGTRMIVSNKVEVRPSGLILAHVFKTSAGLEIRSSNPADFLVSTGGRVHITFELPSPLTPGLRMAGDQVEYFQELRDSGRLTWTIAPGKEPEITREGTDTVVRFPTQLATVLTVF